MLETADLRTAQVSDLKYGGRTTARTLSSPDDALSPAMTSAMTSLCRLSCGSPPRSSFPPLHQVLSTDALCFVGGRWQKIADSFTQRGVPRPLLVKHVDSRLLENDRSEIG